MNTQTQGIITVIGRIMLSLVFLMSAVGNKIPNFSQVANYMSSEGVPASQLSVVSLHVSTPLQNAPSSHAGGAPASQLSVVSLHVSTPLQKRPSSEAGGVPAWQSRTGSQVSEPSQKRPLSQLALLATLRT